MSTYTPIASQTLSASASEVTFTGIPQTYTDLVLVVNSIVASGTGNECNLQFNSDTGSNYSITYLLGSGSAAVSGRVSNSVYADAGYLTTNSGNPNTRIVNIQNYSNTTTNKTIISRASGQNGGQVTAYVNLWRSTAAITSIRIYSSSALTYASGSTFTLYGIGAGSPKAFGGDEVTTDGTYWYHTYRSSGIFAPITALTCDYLVVAGGGSGGGYNNGGGGGAGGFRTSIGGSALSLSAGTNNTVTIGAGGTAVAGAVGTDGSNSVFSTITSNGGGGGGGGTLAGGIPGRSGGSGGGGSFDTGGTGGAGNTPSTSPSQGNNGGSSAASAAPAYGASGGGGAGANGGNGSSTAGGAGGNGTASSISGTSVTYAGGGGGGANASSGTGGTGGGGNGGSTPTAGTVNTGGGGGGWGGSGSSGNKGANGGSGIVIIRYSA